MGIFRIGLLAGNPQLGAYFQMKFSGTFDGWAIVAVAMAIEDKPIRWQVTFRVLSSDDWTSCWVLDRSFYGPKDVSGPNSWILEPIDDPPNGAASAIRKALANWSKLVTRESAALTETPSIQN